ncbi:integral membrane protein DUF92-domain-containing protein [Geopyxis carbonaria]|nr:integral membrane protein DUF92-domain-containing protein [Geopyxis carbonaria]
MNPYVFFTLLTLLVARAYTRRSLTPLGILTAILTALAHGLPATPAPFLLLLLFYTMGTVATRVKHDVKSRLTIAAGGASGPEARTHIQVLANSAVASVLTVLHVALHPGGLAEGWCFDGAHDLLMLGVVANYAAVTADTLSSELGILARSKPRLVTTGRVCAPGTNGGVTGFGLFAGAVGAAIIGAASVPLLGFCDSWTMAQKAGWVAFIGAVGTAGSLLDSVLGAVLQESVVDVRSGKIVEGAGGAKVLVAGNVVKGRGGVELIVKDKKTFKDAAMPAGSRRVEAGWCGVLSNNGVNLLMAAGATLGAMVVAGGWRAVVDVLVDGWTAARAGGLREGIRMAGH